jgi:hypothetical protein
MAAKKKAAARKGGARKSSARKNSSKAQVPSSADRKAQAELAHPPEAVGPGVEHEDHEGGATDSLAKKGVRGGFTSEDVEEAKAIKDGNVRALSVRERQTGLDQIIARGGAVTNRERDADGNLIPASAPKKGEKIVPVVATQLGYYPANGRLRAPGEAFDYVMSKDEKKLPSWMQDATGKLESREVGETTDAFLAGPAAIIEVGRDGSVATRGVTDAEQRAAASRNA